jgi:hypothetical protein
MGIIKSLPARTLPLSIALLIFNQAQANEIFGGAISVNSSMSDNTTKAAVDPIEERQDVYQANLTADYTNWLVAAEANYQFYAEKFAEKSQSDEEYVDGGASLVFGKEQDPFGLELNHSRRMLLQTPDAVGLVQNMDEREIISAAPIARARIFDSDTVFLQGQASWINYLEDDDQDSRRTGGSLGWTHPLSATDVLQLTAQHVNVEFDQQPDSDYRLNDAMLSYAVQLRKLSYRFEAGYNETSPEVGEKEGAPAYKAELGYTSGYNNFSASFSQRITDSSFGDGNAYDPSEIPDGDGHTLGLELIDRKKADVSWNTDILCARCSFFISASLEDDEYLAGDETSRNLYTRSAFIYSLSTAASVEFRADRSKYNFDGADAMEDYRIDYLSIKYSYRFVNGVDVQLFARKEDRDSDTEARSYKENVYGAGLGYFF